MNQLRFEKSPYLLQHAENPVDWRPWSEAAFAAAREEDKPVFLSIGYSTCHWCHVMARECFEDEAVAEVINREFIPIKVDREERPDVDAIYMSACVAMNGSGGWPLTVLTTPEQKPFWSATYVPRDQLIAVLEQIARLWHEDREKILNVGEIVYSELAKPDSVAGAEPGRALLRGGAAALRRAYDKAWGGFSRAPKFPTPHHLQFLLRCASDGDGVALEMVMQTLEHMYRGGIFDHVGGGLCRYSTDEAWLAPHFEKMLYDNALFLFVCSEAYALTRREFLRDAARRTARYMVRELSAPGGGFCCGQDADSEGQEGRYYLFTCEELTSLLGEGADSFCRHYDITPRGNFNGRNIPNLISNEYWEYTGTGLERQREAVYDYRRSRAALHRDDKVLTAWNGLAIAALARYGQIFNDEAAIDRAGEAAAFIADHMRDAEGKLLSRWRDGEAGIAAKLDDLAFYAWGALELYSVTLDTRWLSEAADAAETLLEEFFNRDEGGFYPYASRGEQLLTRKRDPYDGAMPSGNSVAALVLLRLGRLTGEPKWESAADKQLRYLAGAAEGYPAGLTFGLLAIHESLEPTAELICCAETMPPELPDWLRTNGRPGLSVLLKTPEAAAALERLAPFTTDYPIPGNGALYYLCKNRTCDRPVDSIDLLKL